MLTELEKTDIKLNHQRIKLQCLEVVLRLVSASVVGGSHTAETIMADAEKYFEWVSKEA